MATVEVMGPPDPPGSYPRGLKGIENENGPAFDSSSLYSSTDAGNRVSPSPPPITQNLSSSQFGGYMDGLRQNMQARGYLSSGLGKAQNPMETYRSNVRSAMIGSAGSSSHSLGAALNASGGSMYGNEPMLGASDRTQKVAAKRGMAARFLGGKKVFGSRKARLGPSKHEGKNAGHLKAVTGAK